MNPLLEIDNLRVSFRTDAGRVNVLSGVNLSLSKGETLAIVGESGSGKSVTALSILRLLGENARIDEGAVRFGGVDLLGLSDADIRRIRGNQIAMIFQEPMSSLNPVLTIGEQLAEPMLLHKGFSRRQALERAARLLERVAIPDAGERLGEYPHQFSGGMRQRVMIAMALACEPALIIADEPTTALDVTVQAQILNLLKTLTQETGASMILITHDLGLVARYAERVAVMYAGRVVETASVSDLFRRPLHPYTRALMGSAPRLGQEAKTHLEVIPGHPPSLASPVVGCAFAPRCVRVQPLCRQQAPALYSVPGGRAGLCHFALEADR